MMSLGASGMTGGGGGSGGFNWTEDDNFAALNRVGDEWEVSYGFEATAKRGSSSRGAADSRRTMRRRYANSGRSSATTSPHPNTPSAIRRELLSSAGIEASGGKYLPVPDASFLTAAGGGVGGREEAVGETERRDRDPARRTRARTGRLTRTTRRKTPLVEAIRS